MNNADFAAILERAAAAMRQADDAVIASELALDAARAAQAAAKAVIGDMIDTPKPNPDYVNAPFDASQYQGKWMVETPAGMGAKLYPLLCLNCGHELIQDPTNRERIFCPICPPPKTTLSRVIQKICRYV